MDVPTIGDLIKWVKFALEMIKQFFAIFNKDGEEEPSEVPITEA